MNQFNHYKLTNLSFQLFYTKKIDINDYMYEDINIESDKEIITDGKCIDEEVGTQEIAKFTHLNYIIH